MVVCASRWSPLLLSALMLAGCAPKDDPQRRTAEAEAKAAGTDFSAEAAAAAKPTRAATPASVASLRERFQALVPPSCRIDSARAQGEVVWLTGSGENNAAVAAALRAIEQAAAAAEPAGRLPGTELIVLERGPDGRDRFEMRVRSAKLSTP